MTDTTTNPHEARARALAEISQMQTDIVAAHKRVEDLEREQTTLNDRIVLLINDRQAYRSEAMLYRSKLIELATSMANIGLLTQEAQKIMATVKTLGSDESPEQAAAEQESAREIVANLPSIDDERLSAVEQALRGAVGSAVGGETT